MPRSCTVCIHPQRTAIEQAIVVGTSYRNVAKQFSLGFSSVSRHADGHIKQARQEAKQEQAAKDDARALDVSRQLQVINTVTLKVMHTALADKKTHALVLQAVDRVIRQLELQVKMTESGEMEKELEELRQLVRDKWQQ